VLKPLFASILTSAILLNFPAAFAAETSVAALERATKVEGQINSVGMPDTWANWKDTWSDLSTQYGIKHGDIVYWHKI
jgi:putative spermidine/putrescine transport system substrate-binding protein